MTSTIYVFHTSHHAMWAEEVARELDIPIQVVAAPSSADAKCGIALQTAPDRAAELESALKAEGIHFQRS